MRAVFPSMIALAALVVGLGQGCSAGGSPATGPGASPETGSACEGDSQRAVQRVRAAAEANPSCATDADCTTVEIHGSCFDACSSVTNVASEPSVKRAIADAEAHECKRFAAAGCRLTIPPCAPPQAPTCTQGKCQ